jgi:CBS domain-containing protein
MLVEKGDRAVIVKYGGKSVGVVGERAILRGAPNNAKVGDVAVKMECIDEKTPLPIVLAAMEEHNVTAVPICSNGKIRVIDQRELLAESLGLKVLASKKITERYKLEEVGNEPITIDATAKLGDAIRTIVEKNVGLLPVTSDGKLVAVFSEKDAIRAIAENADLDSQVLEYATKNPKVVKCSSTIKEAIDLMLSLKIRHVVGVDDNGRPRCIASVKDLLKIA